MYLNPDIIPSTIIQAVQMIVDGVDEKERAFIKAGCPDYEETFTLPDGTTETHKIPAMIHHGFGTALRNGWSMWEPDTPLKRDAANTYKIAMADDMSGLIIDWAFARIRGEPFDPFAHCQRYEEHWQQICGKTALEAGNWPPENQQELA